MIDLNHSITEANAAIADEHKSITSMRLIKNGASFTLFMKLNWLNEEVFLATARNRKQPREFVDMGRLIKYIEARFPNVKTLVVDLDGHDVKPVEDYSTA